MAQKTQLQQFYIPEEQSIYLLSHDDAKKLKDWVALCAAQLRQLGYQDIELIGKGAYGFVFAGRLPHQDSSGPEHVFKFTRINLPNTCRTDWRMKPISSSRSGTVSYTHLTLPTIYSV